MSTATITITYGDTRVYEIRIFDEVTGLPVDLNEGDLLITCRKRPNNELIFAKTHDEVDVTYEDEEGLALLVLDAEDLALIDNDWHRLDFDVQFVRNTIPQTPIRGVLRVVPSIAEEAVSS